MKSYKILFRIQLYPSLQTMKSVNSIDEQLLPNKENSIVSSTLSIIDDDDDNDDEDMELFPQLIPIKPRLGMQISHQIQY